jgi:hypothetical protein
MNVYHPLKCLFSFTTIESKDLWNVCFLPPRVQLSRNRVTIEILQMLYFMEWRLCLGRGSLFSSFCVFDSVCRFSRLKDFLEDSRAVLQCESIFVFESSLEFLRILPRILLCLSIMLDWFTKFKDKLKDNLTLWNSLQHSPPPLFVQPNFKPLMDITFSEAHSQSLTSFSGYHPKAI